MEEGWVPSFNSTQKWLYAFGEKLERGRSPRSNIGGGISPLLQLHPKNFKSLLGKVRRGSVSHFDWTEEISRFARNDWVWESFFLLPLGKSWKGGVSPRSNIRRSLTKGVRDDTSCRLVGGLFPLPTDLSPRGAKRRGVSFLYWGGLCPPRNSTQKWLYAFGEKLERG
jgi:hypothetical protein